MFVICIIKQTTVRVRVKLKEQLAFPMLCGQVLAPNLSLLLYSLMGDKILNRTRRKYPLFHRIFSWLKTRGLATSWLTEIRDVSNVTSPQKKLSWLNSIILPPKNSGFRIWSLSVKLNSRDSMGSRKTNHFLLKKNVRTSVLYESYN